MQIIKVGLLVVFLTVSIPHARGEDSSRRFSCFLAYRCSDSTQPTTELDYFLRDVDDESQCQSDATNQLILEKNEVCGGSKLGGTPKVPRLRFAVMGQVAPNPLRLAENGDLAECTRLIRCYVADIGKGWYGGPDGYRNRWYPVAATWIANQGKCQQAYDAHKGESIEHRACREATGSSRASAQGPWGIPPYLSHFQRYYNRDFKKLPESAPEINPPIAADLKTH